MPHTANLTSNVILTVECACALFSSGRSAEILAAAQVEIFISEKAYHCTYPIHTELNGQPTRFSWREWIDELRAQNVLQITGPESDKEGDELLNLAGDYGPPRRDGRAMVIALAKQRNWLVGCDELSMMRALDQQQPPGLFTCTLDFVRLWAEERRVEADEIGQTLTNLQTYGVYTPYRNHPSYGWWLRHIGAQPQRDI